MRTELLCFVTLVLLGCATSYQPQGATGGFNDTRLQENAFSVSFQGNGQTSNQRNMDFALLRCAEVTLENGFRYFLITDSGRDVKTIHAFYSSGSSGFVAPINKPSNTYTITCFEEKPEDPAALDAAYLEKSIRGKYNLQQQGGTP
jgi:hypothetical protein